MCIMQFGERLEEILSEKGKKQNWLAQELNKSNSTVNGWIRNNTINLRNIIKICDILGVEVWEFFITDKQFYDKINISKECLDMAKAIDGLDAIQKNKYLPDWPVKEPAEHYT